MSPPPLPLRMQRLAAVLAAIWRLGVSEAFAYRAGLAVWILTTTFPLVSLVLWHSLAAAGPIGGYDQADFVAYFVAAFLIRQFSASWVVWELAGQVRSGDLSPLLLRPVHPLLHHAGLNLAALPVRAVLALPIGIAVLVGVGHTAGLSFGVHLLWAGVAVVLAWLLTFAVQVSIGCLAFWVTSSAALFEVWIGLYMVLSGYAVPTDLFPEAVAGVVRYLPFHAALGFPVELAIGRLDAAAIAGGLALQLGWLVVFAGLSAWLWRRGLRVYGAVGA